jgi:hypothetical protein
VPETGTLGSMSGDGKRGVGHRPQATAPILDSTKPETSAVQRFRPESEDQLTLTERRREDWAPSSRCHGLLWPQLRAPERVREQPRVLVCVVQTTALWFLLVMRQSTMRAG